MGIGELIKYFAEALRGEAENISAFLIGFLVCLSVLVSWRLLPSTRRRRRETADLQRELDGAKHTMAGLHVELQSAKHREQDSGILLRRSEAELREAKSESSIRLHQQMTELQALRHERDRLGQHGHEMQTRILHLERKEQDLADGLHAASSKLEEAAVAQADLDQAREECEELRVEAECLQRQLESLDKLDGRVWEREASAHTSPFRQRRSRRATIIAVVNLKGGVGKTTLTANLGATLWAHDYSTLLVDLDYQGSLTRLCLDEERAGNLRWHVTDLFKEPSQLMLQKCQERIEPSGPGYLIAADEELSNCEMNAMARWLAMPEDREPRFVLRDLLHDPASKAAHDFILLDCPPRLTTACVNALACADYVLVPVLLDATSAQAVPRLFGYLRNLRASVCPDLAVLGLVANRTRGGKLTNRQENVWHELSGSCQDAWGQPVHCYRTLVPQFTEAAQQHRLACRYRELGSRFDGLLEEMLIQMGGVTRDDRQRARIVR